MKVKGAPGPAVTAYGRYLLILLAVVSLFNSMDRFVLSVLIEPIRLELGLSDTQMGLLSGLAFSLFFATFGIPLARLADRGHRVRLLATTVALWSLMTAVSGAAQNFIQMFLARAGVGVGEAGCMPASHSLLGDHYPPERRAFALGVFQGGGGVGTMLGLILAGLIAESLGWRWTFMLIGLPGLLVAWIVLKTLKEPRQQHDAARVASGQALWPTIHTLLGRRTYRQILLAFVFTVAGLYGLIQWLPTFLIRSHGLSIGQVGLWYGPTFGLGIIIGTFAGAAAAPRWIAKDRRWELWWPAIAYALSVPLFLWMFMASDVMLVFALLFIATFIGTTGQGPLMASIQSVAGADLRGMAISIVLAAGVVGQITGPFLAGFFSDYWQPRFGQDSLRYAMTIPMALLAWGVVHLYLGSRSIEADRMD